jgi:hypothetical protein
MSTRTREEHLAAVRRGLAYAKRQIDRNARSSARNAPGVADASASR